MIRADKAPTGQFCNCCRSLASIRITYGASVNCVTVVMLCNFCAYGLVDDLFDIIKTGKEPEKKVKLLTDEVANDAAPTEKTYECKA